VIAVEGNQYIDSDMWQSVQVSDHDYANKEKRAWNAQVLQKMAPLSREAVFTEQGSDHDQVVINYPVFLAGYFPYS
jgi:hypothetical protein